MMALKLIDRKTMEEISIDDFIMRSIYEETNYFGETHTDLYTKFFEYRVSYDSGRYVITDLDHNQLVIDPLKYEVKKCDCKGERKCQNSR